MLALYELKLNDMRNGEETDTARDVDKVVNIVSHINNNNNMNLYYYFLFYFFRWCEMKLMNLFGFRPLHHPLTFSSACFCSVVIHMPE